MSTKKKQKKKLNIGYKPYTPTMGRVWWTNASKRVPYPKDMENVAYVEGPSRYMTYTEAKRVAQKAGVEFVVY